MNRAYHKEIRRSVKKGWKRFLSIMCITALGVAMLTGVYAACLDMYYSADRFFDGHNLFDNRVLSTLGLTQEDVDALAQIEGVKSAQGGYSETAYTQVDGVRKSAELTVIASDINTLYLKAGALPTKPGEIAVTQKYMEESGKAIGDTLTIEEDGVSYKNTTEPQKQADVEEEKAKGKLLSDTDIDWEGEEDWEDEPPTFLSTTYTITGVVIDPKDISANGNVTAFRSTSDTDYAFYITPADADYDIFTVVYLVLEGADSLNCYSDEYDTLVQKTIQRIEQQLKEQREQLRYDAVVAETYEKLEDAKATMDEKFAEADEKFSDAWQEVKEAKIELADGEATLIEEQAEADQKLADAWEELNEAKQELAEGEEEFSDGLAKLYEGEAEINDNAQTIQAGKAKLAQERQQAEARFAAAQAQFDAAQAQLDAAKHQLEGAALQLKADLGPWWPEGEWQGLINATAALAAGGADDSTIAIGTVPEATALMAALPGLDESNRQLVVQTAIGLGKVSGSQQVLDMQIAAFETQKTAAMQQFVAAEAQLAAGEAEIESARDMIAARKEDMKEARAELLDAKQKLAEGQAELEAEEADARKKLADAWEELNEGKQELADGIAELTEQQQKYADKKAEALQKLADGYKELEDLDMTQWYVQDRSSLESYSSFKSDISCIEAVGKAFPVVFLLVAVLMSLTTMTRMVEEERGLIGIYKALGFGNGAVYGKYLLFAFLACLFGAVLGDLFGFIFMPKFVAFILEQELYYLPRYYLRFDMVYGVGGALLFMAGILGATALACRSELVQMPATLMRPKAPRAGARVLLERIPFIWNRLKFLSKVTVRNLFRYKKRLFMTIGGIMGCTALIICGFAIKDSITALAPKQYEHIYRYDLMAVTEGGEHAELLEQMAEDSNIQDYLSIRVESVKLLNADGRSEKVQLMVIPDDANLEDYIRLESREGAPLKLGQSGVLVTRNAAGLLGLESGANLWLQDQDLNQCEAVLDDIAQNYLGNNVYMTQTLYKTLFGDYQPNAVLAHLSPACIDHAAYAQSLLDNEAVLSAVSVDELQEQFGFELINAVVLLITAMAGGLAFVVLFTLSNTNISERVWELATIKVLGFYDNEVHQYVNRETLILTVAGILLGLPVGRFISGLLTSALNLPSIYFAVHIKPTSYLLSAAITFGFALMVNLMTNRTLNRINMVEALKSVE